VKVKAPFGFKYRRAFLLGQGINFARPPPLREKVRLAGVLLPGSPPAHWLYHWTAEFNNQDGD